MVDENRPPAYYAPVLAVDDIIETINSMTQLQVKKADFMPVNPEKLREIYVVILEEFHPNLTFITQQRFRDMGDFIPEEMDAGVVALNIYGLLKMVLQKINFHDICIKDVLMPTPNRTKVILSHLINFWRFVVSQREDAKGPLREKFHALCSKKATLISEGPSIQRKLNDAAAELVGLAELKNELLQQNNVIRSELRERVTKKETVKCSNTEKKANLAKMDQENKTMAEEVAELMDENEKLAERVVGSPKQLEDRVESRKQAITTLKADILKAKKRLNDTIEYARNCSMWRNRVLSLLDHTKAIKEEMTFAIKAKHGDLNVVESKKQAVRENISDLEATHENLNASLKQLQEKIAQLEHQHHVKKNSLKAQLKEAQMSKEKIMTNVNHIDIAWTSATEEYNELTARMKCAKLSSKAAENEAKSHEETVAALDIYYSILATYLRDLERVADRLSSPSTHEEILEMVQNAVLSFDK